MFIFICILLTLTAVAFIYMQQPQFGRSPQGKRLERIKQSPNFKDGSFQNINFTPFVTEGYSMTKITFDFIFGTFPRTSPVDEIPTIRTDLKSLPKHEDVLVWFGHSSYFIQLNGKRFLVDPVFSGNASPLPYTTRAFAGTDIYTVDDLPEIDYLLITHDHYDHLDYPTIVELKPKVRQVVCGLGVGEHFEYWGFDPETIIEKDWNESLPIADGFTLHTATARHFSGRGLRRNNTLWMSYILQTNDYKIYLGGDSGYDTHFEELGRKFNGLDLAILDNGQYNQAWKELHMVPQEVLQAASDLGATKILPVHSSKFKLANHPWDESLIQISELNNTSLITPMIGELVNLRDEKQLYRQWWKNISLK